MKHYEIKKGKNGWIEASVIKPDGYKVTFSNFFSKNEALTWCYAKVNYYYGRKVVNQEF